MKKILLALSLFGLPCFGQITSIPTYITTNSTLQTKYEFYYTDSRMPESLWSLIYNRNLDHLSTQVVQNATSEEDNVFAGYNIDETGITKSIILGHEASHNASGTRNLYLGERTGSGASGDGNTYIGLYSGANSTSSNTLYIEKNLGGTLAPENSAFILDGNVGSLRLGRPSGSLYLRGTISDSLEMGGNDIDNVGDVTFTTNAGIIFNLTSTIDPAIGQLLYDDDTKSLRFGLDDDGSLEIGKEQYDIYTNLEGATITNGQLVSVKAVTGNRIAVELTDCTNRSNALAAIGVVTVPTIANNTRGRITTSGKVRGINTSALTEGAPVYASDTTPGGLSNTLPADAACYVIHVGTCEVVHTTQGVIDVNITVYPKFEDLSGVNGTALATNGQIAVWNNDNSFWDFGYNINNKLNLEADNSQNNFLHSSFSAGRLWGGEITINGTPGKVDIAAGEGIIKEGANSWDNIPANETDGQAGQLSFVSWDTITGLDLAGVGYNLIYWDASATNFAVSLDTTFYTDFDFVTDFSLGRTYYDGTESTIRLCGMNMWNFPRRVQMFGEERFPVERANGLLGSATGLEYAVTDGVIWAEMVNRFEVTGKTLAEDFRYWYSTNATYNAWTYSTTNEIDAADYNGPAGLTSMTANRWRCDYVYVAHDSSHHVVIGNAQYTSAANAQAAAIRTPPGLLEAYATLVGRITVQEGESTMIFDNATPDAAFAAYAVPDHNGLSGLQGGALNEYYHLTATDYTNATNITESLEGKVDINGGTATNLTVSNTLSIEDSGGVIGAFSIINSTQLVFIVNGVTNILDGDITTP